MFGLRPKTNCSLETCHVACAIEENQKYYMQQNFIRCLAPSAGDASDSQISSVIRKHKLQTI